MKCFVFCRGVRNVLVWQHGMMECSCGRQEEFCRGVGNVLLGNMKCFDWKGNVLVGREIFGRRSFNARLGGISSVVEAGNILMCRVGSRKCFATPESFLEGDRKCSGMAATEMFWWNRKCSGGGRQCSMGSRK
jgi:hypothetical protein